MERPWDSAGRSGASSGVLVLCEPLRVRGPGRLSFPWKLPSLDTGSPCCWRLPDREPLSFRLRAPG